MKKCTRERMKLLTQIFQKKEKKANGREEKRWIIPELRELTDVPLIYEAEQGFKIQITKDLYSIEEPSLTEQEKKYYQEIKEAFYEIINIDETENPESYVNKGIKFILTELDIPSNESQEKKYAYLLKKEFLGFGKIEALLKDPLISSILWDGEGTLTVKQRRYGSLKTNISLTEEETKYILTKALLSCKKDLPQEEQKSICENEKAVWSILWKKEKSLFSCEKKIPQIYSPAELIEAKRASAEMYAYLWMLIEEKKTIFIINEPEILYSLSFFLPAHAKVLTNTEEFLPNQYTQTIIGNATGEENFSFIKEWETTTLFVGSLIATTKETLNEEENIICYTEKGKIRSIKEYGRELFVLKENKFLFNINDSLLNAMTGNKAIRKEECMLRAKLIALLVKNKIPAQDFKKIIAVYYKNPEAVLKKAGLR